MEIIRGNITTISPAAKAVFREMVRIKKEKNKRESDNSEASTASCQKTPPVDGEDCNADTDSEVNNNKQPN